MYKDQEAIHAAASIYQADATPQHVRMLVLCFAILLAAAWIGFAYTTYAALMVVISLFYCIMYFGLPLVMFRMRRNFMTRHKMTLPPPARENGFQTFTGWTNNRDAMIQMMTIPGALALAMVCIAAVNIWARH